ncbi:MAG: Gfo/Idh/MocA family oxidoreductase [Proteobacteria bacterium]|nr:Gfo/Idh/MocA family oxidoreductase [Pseudomonadota bacterium]
MASVLAAEFASLPTTEVRLLAIAGRNAERTAAFAAAHDIARTYHDIEALARDPDIDALYIATPHTLHYECLLAAIEAGKAVLCEKPFTLNARQAAEVIALARRRGVFVMEAMWTRFLPAIAALRELVAAGTLGRIELLVGGGAFMPDRHGGHYLFDPHRGGGVLLDAGVYLVSLSSMLLGQPRRIQAAGRLGDSGVDEQDAWLFEHACGAMASLYVSLHARRSPDLEILGDAGRIRIAAPVFRPTRLHLWDQQGNEQLREYPITGSGYGYQVRAVNQALLHGQSESPVMPLDETLTIMQTLDSIREQMGLIYPAETGATRKGKASCP